MRNSASSRFRIRLGNRLGLSGDPVVHLHAEAVIDFFESAETGNQKFDGPSQMRRAAQHKETFSQRILNQVILIDVQVIHGFLQVADAPMDHLGGGCGTPRCEITRLDDNGFETSQLRVQGATGSARASADNTHIELLPFDVFQSSLRRLFIIVLLLVAVEPVRISRRCAKTGRPPHPAGAHRQRWC